MDVQELLAALTSNPFLISLYVFVLAIFVGFEIIFLLLFKLIAKCHQLINLGNDAVLFAKGWDRRD